MDKIQELYNIKLNYEEEIEQLKRLLSEKQDKLLSITEELAIYQTEVDTLKASCYDQNKSVIEKRKAIEPKIKQLQAKEEELSSQTKTYEAESASWNDKINRYKNLMTIINAEIVDDSNFLQKLQRI